MIPVVSILIANFNKEAYLPYCLQSISSQSFQAWECLLIDDGCTDSSLEVMNSFALKDKRFRILQRPTHIAKGSNTCRNIALASARGEYVIFFDSDDIMSVNLIEQRMTEIEKTDCDFLVFQGIFWDLKSDKSLLIADFDFKQIADAFFQFQPIWLSQSLIIRKKFLSVNKIRWDEKIPFYQDVFFNIQLLQSEGKYQLMDQIDWIWRKITNESLGAKTKKINSYSDNHLLAVTYQKALVHFFSKEESEKRFLWFCLNRFDMLLKLNKEAKCLKNIMAYADALKKEKIFNRIQQSLVPVVFRLAIFSFPRKFRPGISIYLRTKKVLMSKLQLPSISHVFLSKELSMQTDLLVPFQKTLNKFSFDGISHA